MRTGYNFGKFCSFAILCQCLHDGRMVRSKIDKNIAYSRLFAVSICNHTRGMGGHLEELTSARDSKNALEAEYFSILSVSVSNII